MISLCDYLRALRAAWAEPFLANDQDAEQCWAETADALADAEANIEVFECPALPRAGLPPSGSASPPGHLTETRVRAIVAEELDRFCLQGYLAPTFAEYVHRRALNAPE